MPLIGSPSLDHLRIFVAVAEEGSFAAAGRKLGRAVSVISYAIATLESQLGLPLFLREATRPPQPTEAGRAILADARRLQRGMAQLEARARGLLAGLEAQIALAVDGMYPAERLSPILRAFQQAFPTVSLRLQTESLGAVAACLIEGEAQIALGGPPASAMPGLAVEHAGWVQLVPVCAPGHPLARAATLAPGEESEHVQLVLTDRSALTRGQDFAVRSPHTWRLADLGAKHALLREGIGWGNMPLPMVEGDLRAGALVRLALPADTGGLYRFAVLRREDRAFGPAAEFLRQAFLAAALDPHEERPAAKAPGA